MVSWLSKGKPTTSLFREHVKIGVIAWGDELLGGVSWFLGRCLNLCLVNPLQGFSFSFFVKGSKALGSILEHMTGAGALVELYHAPFPVYCQIMLL